ncbi:uncharacterized protein BDZ83DRAFT_598533 [Colletotrichum acutatum]|uniref:Uncharacterized protein n=1 Tax=Glomerella acutata TaxID=27357 RepID=A0AAD9D324_GLOAC|nr:uncharacterized protein BDZ83DRAFT_598533 [Colletotrichum acutatum]KAK1731245.1 hypothetical protein BDZ83DRAFT_598533 [Colletotrichum acutatum]
MRVSTSPHSFLPTSLLFLPLALRYYCDVLCIPTAYGLFLVARLVPQAGLGLQIRSTCTSIRTQSGTDDSDDFTLLEYWARVLFCEDG